MRQAIGLLEDISVQADNHLAKVLMACHHSQSVLALLFPKHCLQTLELDGVAKELKGDVVARATV